jgi:hypothetical protein
MIRRWLAALILAASGAAAQGNEYHLRRDRTKGKQKPVTRRENLADDCPVF